GFCARLASSADKPPASRPSSVVARTGPGAVLTLSRVALGNAVTYGASAVAAVAERPRTNASSAVRTTDALAASIGLDCCAYQPSSAPVGRVTLSVSIQSAIASSDATGRPSRVN